MRYHPVLHSNDTLLLFVHKLYHDAFPAEERRDWSTLLRMLGQTPQMQLEVIIDKDRPVGFIISWILDGWCFIEHLAIDPVCRGKKYGGRVITDFMNNRQLILEVEPPLSAVAIRRINFYERLGLTCLPFAYAQPSYTEPGQFYPMVLMTSGTEKEEKQFISIIQIIKDQVYLTGVNKRNCC